MRYLAFTANLAILAHIHISIGCINSINIASDQGRKDKAEEDGRKIIKKYYQYPDERHFAFSHMLQLQRSDDSKVLEPYGDSFVMKEDRIQALVQASHDSTLYLIYCSGMAQMTFPSDGAAVAAKELTRVPSRNHAQLLVEDVAGPEIIYLLLSRTKLDTPARSVDCQRVSSAQSEKLARQFVQQTMEPPAEGPPRLTRNVPKIVRGVVRRQAQPKPEPIPAPPESSPDAPPDPGFERYPQNARPRGDDDSSESWEASASYSDDIIIVRYDLMNVSGLLSTSKPAPAP